MLFNVILLMMNAKGGGRGCGGGAKEMGGEREKVRERKRGGMEREAGQGWKKMGPKESGIG